MGGAVFWRSTGVGVGLERELGLSNTPDDRPTSGAGAAAAEGPGTEQGWRILQENQTPQTSPTAGLGRQAGPVKRQRLGGWQPTHQTNRRCGRLILDGHKPGGSDAIGSRISDQITHDSSGEICFGDLRTPDNFSNGLGPMVDACHLKCPDAGWSNSVMVPFARLREKKRRDVSSLLSAGASNSGRGRTRSALPG